MKKDKKWFVDKWTEERDKSAVHDPMYHFINEFITDVKELDEPEVLSQEWIEKHTWNNHYIGKPFVYVEDLQNLIVPKEEELETKIQELIESYKQEEDAYSNPENGWISGFIEDLKNLVEKEPMYYALIKGHELTDSYDIYWNVDRSDYGVFVSRLHPLNDNFITEMSKEAWNELGINDSNADFIKVEEMK